MRSVLLSALGCCAINLLLAQKSIYFTPATYHNVYTSRPAPVLRINPGDTVYTTSVDAGGLDQNGVRVAKRGNPLTGPFYIENAQPGDVIAITLLNVKLTRDFATTLNTFIPIVLPKSTGKKTWRTAKLFRWKLDRDKMMGSPVDSGMHLKNLSVPLHPFMGCVGIAPPGDKEIGTGGSGPSFGGNFDFKYITSGATVYLGVNHPGALVFIGDGHAAQGDGELNGDALETSMSFGFTTRILKKEEFPLQTPMIENAEYLMFFGMRSSLDKSYSAATQFMTKWLQDNYDLKLSEASKVIGPAVEFRIPKTAAKIAEVVAMIPKNLLQQLTKK